MRRALLGVLLVLTTAPVRADPLPVPPPGGVLVSEDGRVVISSTLCPVLGGVPGEPPADYTPGVDARGQAVAPADLPGSVPAPALGNFPIEIDARLRRHFHLPAGSRFLRGKAVVGLVTLQDGRAYFNGAPLSDGERDMMAAACGERKR